LLNRFLFDLVVFGCRVFVLLIGWSAVVFENFQQTVASHPCGIEPSIQLVQKVGCFFESAVMIGFIGLALGDLQHQSFGLRNAGFQVEDFFILGITIF